MNAIRRQHIVNVRGRRGGGHTGKERENLFRVLEKKNHSLEVSWPPPANPYDRSSNEGGDMK
jgi:hypothetical protein